MVVELILPKLGMAAAVATLTSWGAKEGGRVEKGQTVLEIEAEKSAFEMPSPADGFLHILVPEGEERDVNTVVGLIAATEEEYAGLLHRAVTGAPSSEAGSVAATVDPAPVRDASKGPAPSSPVARKMAAEHGIDLATIQGTGAGGRIQKEDVEQAIAERRSGAAAVAQAGPAPGSAPDMLGKRVGSRLPYRGMRKSIGENMRKSLAVNAPNTFSGDFDLTEMVQLRERLVAQERELGTRITYAEMVIHAVAKALTKFPLMNSSLIDGEILLWDGVNIGVAVALGADGDEGLVVPVIRGAGSKSLVDISLSAKALAERAREQKLTPDDMSGGTFTVSNFGSVGASSYSTPIINLPESGILGIGRMTKKPVVKGDAVVIAPVLPYSLTHDHRVIDGAAAVNFIGILARLIETPELGDPRSC